MPASCLHRVLLTKHAGVGHFKTLFELSGPAAVLLKSLSPAQLSVVVEGLGRAGAKDADFYNLVSAQVRSLLVVSVT